MLCSRLGSKKKAIKYYYVTVPVIALFEDQVFILNPKKAK